jgi:2-C-methyl-D-erythritol 4-phosphate cytidylyltransferase
MLINMEDNEKVGVIIAAAGEGRRMNGMDKVFASLAGRPALAHVIDVFASVKAISRIAVLVNEKNLQRCRQLIAAENWPVPIVCGSGGQRRQDSVAAGLRLLEDCDWIIVHDGARPLVTPDLITRGLQAAAETGAAAAAVPITDTIKLAGEDLIVKETLFRANLWAVQTPQVFRYDIISRAHARLTADVTDDASLVEKCGGRVKLFQGAYDNIKLTNPGDLALAGILLERHGK